MLPDGVKNKRRDLISRDIASYHLLGLDSREDRQIFIRVNMQANDVRRFCRIHRHARSRDLTGRPGRQRHWSDNLPLAFAGLLTHSGQAYKARDRAGARRAAEEERRAVAGFAGRLRDAGLEVPEVSVGSTPAMAAAADLAGVTEARPGNYALYDGTQAAIGTCAPADCALTVLASVVSRRPAHAVIDAGALALSKDAGPVHLGAAWRWGMGAVFEDEAAYRAGRPSERLCLAGLSQEHGVVSGPLPVGSRLRVLPNHSCLAVPCFDAYWVVRGDEVVGRWRIRRERV